jgi:acetoin:2,6-dichlorophenolindophenol oxidoreductase subunit beta
VVLFGEDVAKPGGVFATNQGFHDKHGGERVFDTPISELAIAGAAFGSAVCGLRPVIEIMFGDFLTLAMDSLVNQSANYCYLSGGRPSVPIVVRAAVGAGGNFGAIHSQTPISWFHNVPGLKLVAPSTPTDAKALLKAAIRDDNPVLFFEHKRLYSITEEADGAPDIQELGKAAVVHEGRDVTLVSCMKGVRDCLAAAEVLADEGIEAEVIEVRTIRPWTTRQSLRRLQRPTASSSSRRGRSPAVGPARSWRWRSSTACTT